MGKQDRIDLILKPRGNQQEMDYRKFMSDFVRDKDCLISNEKTKHQDHFLGAKTVASKSV